MKNTVLIILAILLATPLLSQNQKKRNELTVINMLGAKVYEKPTFNSKTLIDLPVGEKVIIDKHIETNEKFQIGTGFSLVGQWVKPKGIDGFIFSSDLTERDAEIGMDEFDQTYVDLLGKLTKEKAEEKRVKTPGGEFPKYFEYKYFENGTYTYIAWDGCFTHIKEYNSLTINEIYHQMVSDYGIQLNGNEFSIPAFLEKAESKIKFDGKGATQDLTIEFKENGSIVVSSYDCT